VRGGGAKILCLQARHGLVKQRLTIGCSAHPAIA
jgi:hypothetical protein